MRPSRVGFRIGFAVAVGLCVVWHADGDPHPTPPLRIAFESNRDGNWDIVTMDADGATPLNLNRRDDRPEVSDVQAAWSPDGSKIVFLSDTDEYLELWVMHADGSGRALLTENEAWDGDPAWSPDGFKIAFATNRDGYSEIYVMNADGSDPVNLTRHPAMDYAPAWSPDGSKIAFHSDRNGGDMDIIVMDADGANPINLTHPAEEGTKGPWADVTPAWSPDGSKIAYGSRRDGNWEIYAMNADGSDPVNLSRNAARDGDPCWSPDGKRIAFHTNRDGNWEIYVMNADGSDPVNLTRNPADDLSPAWSPYR